MPMHLHLVLEATIQSILRVEAESSNHFDTVTHPATDVSVVRQFHMLCYGGSVITSIGNIRTGDGDLIIQLAFLY